MNKYISDFYNFKCCTDVLDHFSNKRISKIFRKVTESMAILNNLNKNFKKSTIENSIFVDYDSNNILTGVLIAYFCKFKKVIQYTTKDNINFLIKNAENIKNYKIITNREELRKELEGNDSLVVSSINYDRSKFEIVLEIQDLIQISCNNYYFIGNIENVVKKYKKSFEKFSNLFEFNELCSIYEKWSMYYYNTIASNVYEDRHVLSPYNKFMMCY